MPTFFAASALATALTAATAALADLVPFSQAPFPNTDWRNIPDGYRLLPPLGSASTHASDTDNLHLFDTVLLASVDGKLHALNRTSGAELWSMSSPAQNNSVSSILGPLISTKRMESDGSVDDDEDDENIFSSKETYVIEPQTGDIFVMSTPSGPLQRLPFSMPQLVHMSPFHFTDGDNTRLFVGKKETSLLLIELETGKIKRTINAECPWSPMEDIKKSKEVDLDELEADEPPPRPSTEVYIGRTDYHVLIETVRLDTTSPNPPMQSLSFSTYGPNNQDVSLQSLYRRTADDAYIQSLSSGDILSFKARPLDPEATVPRKPEIMWMRQFPHPIVATFDVVSTAARHRPFILIQPHPRLEEVFPHTDILSAARENRFSTLDSAYIGMVQETGSLYAMTPESFPLLLFGESDNRVDSRMLIDAPPGTRMEDLPAQVDEITRQRQLRELCNSGSMDMRCFTGIRRLEENSRSRYSRLLDAPSNHQDETTQTVSGQIGSPNGTPDLPLILMNSSSASVDTVLIGTALGFSFMAPFVVAIILILSWSAWKWTSVWRARMASHSVPLAPSIETLRALDDQVLSTPFIADEEGASTMVKADMQSQPELKSDETMAASTPINTESQTNLSSVIKFQESPADDNNDDSDKDDDPSTTPGKRKTRRGRRAKKKKVSLAVEPLEEKQIEMPLNNIPPPTPSPAIVVISPPPPSPQASLIVSDTVLGFGSHGTVVFEGSLQGRSVAVKRLLQDFVTLASREVSILQESDDHPNVIRYYYQEIHANFLYIALELCPASLADIVENPDQFRDLAINFEPKKALQQITSGLRHLHGLKLVHRDIKPQNILVSTAKSKNGRGGLRMLISDFGLCKRLEIDQTSFIPTAHGAMAAGTVGWRAPEILRGEVSLFDPGSDDVSQSSRGSVGSSSSNSTSKPTRLTKSVDIFALGCLFYYALTNGSHPYGDRFEREVNIMRNEKCLEGLERFGEEGSEAVDLISKMLGFEAKERPDTSTCLLHPFFWDPARRLNFLQDASDRFEIMCRDPIDPNLVILETNSTVIVGNDWYARLDKVFIENLGKFRKYDSRSVRDLLRALRNKKHHYQDLPDNVKRHLGPMPEGFLGYFTRRFPALFLHVHSVISSTSLRHEPMFRSYFELPD